VSPHQVTREFEGALCRYTGAKYAVTTTSCTQAILMALAWELRFKQPAVGPHGWIESVDVWMPSRSYVGVPAAIRNAGGRPRFHDQNWRGEYQFSRGTWAGTRSPMATWDSARRFTSGMYRPGAMQCVSFHATKILADSQGGAILHDNDEADAWLRRARFDGRTEGADPKTDQVQSPSWHAYLSPDVAARLLWKLQGLPAHNDDLPNSDYPDLSTMEAFK
jgi:dTDP-4-amino-4,6-dideoxygalactose transaminase